VIVSIWGGELVCVRTQEPFPQGVHLFLRLVCLCSKAPLLRKGSKRLFSLTEPPPSFESLVRVGPIASNLTRCTLFFCGDPPQRGDLLAQDVRKAEFTCERVEFALTLCIIHSTRGGRRRLFRMGDWALCQPHVLPFLVNFSSGRTLSAQAFTSGPGFGRLRSWLPPRF